MATISLSDATRHEPLCGEPWSEPTARATIRAIVAEACARFDRQTLWPTHPRDVEDGHPTLPLPALYNGAAGALWALRHLQRAGAADVGIDIDAAIASIDRHVPSYLEATRIERPSYFLGETGVRLLQWSQRRAPEHGQTLYDLVRGNLRNPAREALWGSPGTLVAAVHVLEATGDARWQALLREGIDILWEQMHTVRHSDAPDREVHVWTQELPDRRRVYIGAGHGFAGNVFPALLGRRWLDAAVVDGFEARAFETLDLCARRDAGHVNWEMVFDLQVHGWPSRPLVQDCHGAPGIVCRLASTRCAPLRELLVQAGELVWAAGPLTKPPGLCHGTDGNGYALLKLHAMTGDTRWLDRARAFAMHAITQSDALRAVHGQRRFTLWTGDLGLAVYLWGCLTGDAALPVLDTF